MTCYRTKSTVWPCRIYPTANPIYPRNPKTNPRNPTIGKSEILERQRHTWGESTNIQNIILIPHNHPTNPRNPNAGKLWPVAMARQGVSQQM